MQILTVSQVTTYLRGVLDTDELLFDLWVSGEVSSLSRSPAGHVYFTLKDGQSQLRCVMFRGQARGVALEQGAAILAHGRVSLWEAGGSLQLYVDLVQPEGVGVLHLRFEQLRARLEAEGLFDVERKRSLPRFPRRIGVVTSPTGAVLHDIVHVLSRRYPLVELVVAPAVVQGDRAAPTIVAAIEALNALGDLDVVVVARGGGSIEELWPFNEEAVARAIFASRTPVVSAVGHETDFTIADFVADLRAPTPSAAAELVTPDGAELQLQVGLHRRAIESALVARLDATRDDLRYLTGRLGRQAPDIAGHRQQVDALAQAGLRQLGQLLALRREGLRGRCLQLHALSPLLTLARGYAVASREDTGETVSRVAQATPGTVVRVRVQDGAFRAGVLDGDRPLPRPLPSGQ